MRDTQGSIEVEVKAGVVTEDTKGRRIPNCKGRQTSKTIYISEKLYIYYLILRLQEEESNSNLMETVIMNERDQVLATGRRDYAKRPTSYKSSLSLALPVGTVRRKSR